MVAGVEDLRSTLGRKPVVFVFPQEGWEMYLDTDASGFAIALSCSRRIRTADIV